MRVQRLLDPLDEAPVECDGFVRLAHPVLATAGIAHWWIELDEGWVVDYRARLCFGASAPHGLHRQPSGFEYRDQEEDIAVLSDGLFKILTES